MTLIEEADEKLILVSPYCKFSKWYKFLNKLEFAKSRKIPVEFYIRAGENESKEEILSLGFAPIQIPNLHCKLYLNEKYGIVSSMNLLLSSDTNSLDIAYKTTTEEEYNELIKFYERYLQQRTSPNPLKLKPSADQTILANYDWKADLVSKVKRDFPKKHFVKFNGSRVIIDTGKKCEAFISNEKINFLRISCILSSSEFSFLQREKSIFNEDNKLRLQAQKGNNNFYDMIWGTGKNALRANNLLELNAEEGEIVVECVVQFLHVVHEIKNGAEIGI